MNLETLLEAAKFLELRDQMLNENFNAASTTTAAATTNNSSIATSTTTTTTVVHTTSNFTLSAGAQPSTTTKLSSTFGGSGPGGTTIVQKGTISDAISTIQQSSLNLLTSSGTGVVGAKVLGGTAHQSHSSPTVINISSSLPSEPARQSPNVLSHRKRALEANSYASASSTVISNNLSQNVTSSSSSSSHNGTSQTKKEQDGHISSTTMNQTQRHRVMQSSFDIMKPLIIDESGPVETKRSKPTPLPFRAGTREVHNKLEKHRRAQLKECFDALKKQLPENTEERKSSNLSILHSAVKTIEELKEQERQFSIEMERLGQEKVALNTRLAALRKDSSLRNVDVSRFLSEISSSSTHNGHSKRDSLSDSLLSTSPSLSNSSLASPRPRSTASPSYTVVEPTSFNICGTSGDSDSFCELKNESNLSMMNLGNASNVVTVASPGMVTIAGSSVATVSSSDTSIETGVSMIGQTNSSVITTTNGNGDSNKLSIPILSKNYPIVTTTTPQSIVSKEVTETGISVVPVSYPVSQGLVLQKVAILPPKGVTELTPLMQTHFISPPLNGQISKVVPITQYIVKPMVVVSTANQRPGS